MSRDTALGDRREHLSAGRIDNSQALVALLGDQQARLRKTGRNKTHHNRKGTDPLT